MTNMKDDELIKEVSGWEKTKEKLEREKIQKDFELKREKIQNRKDLIFAFGKNIKIGTIIVVPILALIYLFSQCGPTPEEKLQYEEALKECVDKIGYENCGQILTSPGPEYKLLNQQAKDSYGLCVKNLDAKKCDIIKDWNG